MSLFDHKIINLFFTSQQIYRDDDSLRQGFYTDGPVTSANEPPHPTNNKNKKLGEIFFSNLFQFYFDFQHRNKIHQTKSIITNFLSSLASSWNSSLLST